MQICRQSGTHGRVLTSDIILQMLLITVSATAKDPTKYIPLIDPSRRTTMTARIENDTVAPATHSKSRKKGKSVFRYSLLTILASQRFTYLSIVQDTKP